MKRRANGKKSERQGTAGQDVRVLAQLLISRREETGGVRGSDLPFVEAARVHEFEENQQSLTSTDAQEAEQVDERDHGNCSHDRPRRALSVEVDDRKQILGERIGDERPVHEYETPHGGYAGEPLDALPWHHESHLEGVPRSVTGA